MFLIVSRNDLLARVWEAAWQRCGEMGSVYTAICADPAESAHDKQEIRLVGIDLAILSTDRVGRLRQWKAAYPGCPFILGGDEFSSEREIAALGAGMSACCDQRLAEEPLSRVMRVVLGGGVWISAATLPLLMNRLGNATRTGDVPQANSVSGQHYLSLLTERQRQVAALLMSGESNKAIGRKLDIADRTVKAHLTAIFEKLNVSDRLQLAVLLNRRESGESTAGIRSLMPIEPLVR